MAATSPLLLLSTPTALGGAVDNQDHTGMWHLASVINNPSTSILSPCSRRKVQLRETSATLVASPLAFAQTWCTFRYLCILMIPTSSLTTQLCYFFSVLYTIEHD